MKIELNKRTQPFDPASPDCSRDDDADRKAVISGQRFAILLNGQNDVTSRIQRFR